jgi:antitoxin MazE
MKVNLISIGNSKGIRIPRSVIKACGFSDQVDMRVSDGTVVLAPARDAREHWDAAFERMAAAGDDALLVPEQLEHEWDEEEWEW